jgi:methionyl-tRNA formyltransferase
MTRFAVVGSGKMAVDILSHLSGLAGSHVVLAIADTRHETHHSHLADAAGHRQLPCQQTGKLNEESLRLLAEADLDYIVSANNHLIFKAPHLATARKGVINFHNGPLPRYAGLNPCSWALLNGETSYGVTWHFVDEGIDTGGVVLQKMFPIPDDATVIELIAQCIDTGLDLFPILADKMLSGGLETIRQIPIERSYYGGKDRPWNGDFPFWLSQVDLVRLAKALAFWPMPNLFYRPRLRIKGHGDVFVGRYDYESAAWLGKIGEANRSDDGLTISVDGGLAHLGELVDLAGQPIDLTTLGQKPTVLQASSGE